MEWLTILFEKLQVCQAEFAVYGEAFTRKLRYTFLRRDIKIDQIKIGKFIAALRKEKGMMQEQLGEKLSVTDKTISRWENGNYIRNALENF